VPYAAAPRATTNADATTHADAAAPNTAAPGERVAGKARNTEDGGCRQYDNRSIRHE
jgi:hypothetical protein